MLFIHSTYSLLWRRGKQIQGDKFEMNETLKSPEAEAVPHTAHLLVRRHLISHTHMHLHTHTHSKASPFFE